MNKEITQFLKEIVYLTIFDKSENVGNVIHYG